MSERYSTTHARASATRFLAGLCLALALGMAAQTARAADPIRFGAPPWPGVTVKTQVVTQLLGTIGYETHSEALGTEAVILNGLAEDDLDAYLALWYPLSAGQLDPLVEKGKVIKHAKNLEGALLGLAVPRYVHEAGVDSVHDLAEHAERFNRKIYGIESGNYWNTQAKAAVKEDRYGLGDWEVVPSSTAAMLTQVGRAVDRGEWILFYGWRPHWMNVPYDLYYLEAPEGSAIADVSSTVYTITRADFPDAHPNVARFLAQFHVSLEAQNRWIYEHGYKDRPETEVAREWITANLDTVRQWVEGVETASGGSAWQAIEAEFGG